MHRKRLILIDNIFFPIYWMLSQLAAIRPKKSKNEEEFVIVKLFGLGSITRIMSVASECDIKPTQITFVSLDKNSSMIHTLGAKILPIQNGGLKLVFSVFNSIYKVWRKKQVIILDMERTSNIAGIFSIFLAVNKPRRYFSLKQNANHQTVELKNKAAIHAIAEMFGRNNLSAVNRNRSSAFEIKDQIIVNINAGDYLSERRFPLDQYKELLIRIHKHFPSLDMVLTGSIREKKRVESFAKDLKSSFSHPEKIRNLSGQLNLHEFLTTIQSSKWMLTNDSGPLHFAYYYGVPSICIWGPTSASLVGYPNSAKMLNLVATLPCSPCFIHPKSEVAANCNGKMDCFKEMKTEIMVNCIKDFILNN